MHHQIDACIMCQSLTDEERRGIVETAHALQPEIKCAVLDFAESEVAIEGVDLIRGLVGPSTLLNAVERLPTQKEHAHPASVGISFVCQVDVGATRLANIHTEDCL
jgi:hypothetical protein